MDARATKLSQMAFRDSIGAAFSALGMLICGVLLPHFLGLPLPIASILVAIAVGFCAHSYLAAKKIGDPAKGANSTALLQRIASLNMAYLAVTLSIVAILWNDLTVIGRLFLIGEATILLPLSLYELRLAKEP